MIRPLRAWTLGLLLATPLAVACERGPGPTSPDEAVIEDISESEILAAGELADLTDEQKAAVRRILREARARLDRLRRALRSGEIGPDEARSRARAIHQEAIEALSEILTDEQVAGLLRHRPGEPRRGGGPGLDLSEDQRAAIQALHAEFRAFVAEQRARVANGELSAEEARANVRARAAELRAEVCATLTPAQRDRVRHCGGTAGG